MAVTINGSTGIAGVDGSAGTPAVQGADSNTGMFFPAADTIAFAEGGAEVARFDSSGNLGIGTSSPNSKLNTYAAANALSIQYVATNQNAVSPTAAIGFNVSDSSETTAACAKGGIGFTRNAAFGGGYLAFYNNNSGAAGNFTTADERARIDSSGNLLVGTTTSSGNGNLIAAGVYNNTTASGANVQVDNTGPGLLRRSTSSVVYKTDVEPIKAAYIDNALKFRPVWYRSLCDGDRKDWSWYGLIAEEVGAIDPRLVHWRMLDTSVDENGQTVQTPLEKPVAEGVMYDRVVVLALGLIQKQQIAIQEQQALIAALQADVAALKGAQA